MSDSDLMKYKTFMTLGEVRQVAKHLGNLADMMAAKHVHVANHIMYDENGEAIGEIMFDGAANSYVFGFDYIHENHGEVTE